MSDNSCQTSSDFSAVFLYEDGWYIGWIEEIPGAFAQERTLEEARQSLFEAAVDVIEVNRQLAATRRADKKSVSETLLIAS